MSDNNNLDKALKNITNAINEINNTIIDFELRGDHEKVNELKLVISTLQMSQKIILYGLDQD